MILKEFLDLYDNWNGYAVINDNNLKLYARCKTAALAENKDNNYTTPLNSEVVSFGFYDNELTIRVDM